MYNVRELKPNEHEKWNAFLANSAQGTLFHRLDWNQMLVDTDPQTDGFTALACMDKNEDLVAALTIPHRLASSQRSAGSQFFGYVTPLLADSLRYAERHHTYSGYSALADLTKGLAEQIGNVRLNNSPDIWDTRSFMFNAWQIETIYTHEWFHTDDAWGKVSPGLRSVIQQGEKKFTLQVSADEKWDNLFASRNPRIDSTVLKKRLAWMRGNGTGCLYALTDSQNQPAAFTLAMLSQPDRRAYLWGTACTDAKAESETLSVLLWQVCAALASDYPRVDLGYSANIQVSQVKDKLGGRLLPTFITSCSKEGKSGKSQQDGE